MAIAMDRDVNMEVAGALYDLALAHPSRHGKIAYRRAARSVSGIERPITEHAAAGTVREVPFVGPASERVILECLRLGESPMVERSIAEAKAEDLVARARALRVGFLSRAAVLQVLATPMPGVVGLDDYRGDLQMHTRWSDGADTLEAMAEAAMARGHTFAAITDHSYGLAIAGGMSMADAARQRGEIEMLERRLAGRFRILAGIEANIRLDGSIDLEPDEIARFEIVLAAPHSALRKTFDQTARMVAAVRHPGIHVLAHPRGRMLSRPGVLAGWSEVFAEAARRGVAIELDGDPYRQDLDHRLAREALAAGCIFALDSDAHSGAQLRYSEHALAHARIAGVPADRVINCWPLERLLEWAERRAGRIPASKPRTEVARGGHRATLPPARSRSRR